MKFTKLLFAFCALLLFSVPGHSTAVLDFGTGNMGSGGTIAVSGTTVTGTLIPVDSFTVTGLGVFDGVYDTQGAATGTGHTLLDPNSAALSFNSALGTIQVIGGISALGVPNGTVLLNGTGDTITFTLAGSSFINVSASGPDTKSPLLLAALGLPANTPFNIPFSFSIAARGGLTGPYTAFSTDVSNTSPIPEPASLTLLGSGLLGLVGMVRRKRKASKV